MTVAIDMLSLSEEYIASLPDSGNWRTFGVTHWHLVRWETATYGAERFQKEIIAGHVARGTPCDDPHEALLWVTRESLAALSLAREPDRYFNRRGWRTFDDVRLSIDVSWEFMTDKPTGLVPIGGGLAVNESRSACIYAEPMTKDRCRQH